MQSHPSFRNVCRRFGDVTSLVNALRKRRIYQFSSVRLLAELVEVMRGSQPRQNGDVSARQRVHRLAPTASTDVLDSDWRLIRRAAASSPCLFRSLHLAEHPKMRTVTKGPTIHRVLLCQRDDLGAPVVGLAHLLAAAIARQFDEPAAAVTLEGGRAHARLWVRTREVRPPKSSDSYAVLVAALIGRISSPKAATRPPLLHIVLASPGPARSLFGSFKTPPGFEVAGSTRSPDVTALTPDATAGYDRIVYLTDMLPDRAPGEWVKLLTKAARSRDAATADRNGPYFCSFIPTLVCTPAARGRAFDTEPVDQEFDRTRRQQSPDPSWRLERDQCRAPFAELQNLRNQWATGGTEGSLQTPSVRTLLADPGARDIADRWARAITNRRVGVALSGGGALSYRLVPIIKGIRQKQVPIDIVSGVSGGALVGAYFCREGVPGLDRCIELGKRIDVFALAKAFFVGGTFERLVNNDLGDADVTSLDTRLVALATAMFEKAPPASHVVTRGTLGAAVQVSGAAPVLFSPTVKKTSHGEVRFADGATSAFIPARILRDCGADLVFAFNCLAGPENRNPLSDWGPPGRWVYKLPFADRLIDLWISGSYLAQRIGRETDEDAHVYFEPDEEKRPLLESFRFTSGKRIAAESSMSNKVKCCIDDCLEAWSQFRRST